MDVIIVTGTNSFVIVDIIITLQNYFIVKDLGHLYFFLGIEVYRHASGLFLSQAQYISNLLVKTNMHNSKPITTPMSLSLKLSVFDGVSFEDPILYRSVVGSLPY